VLESASVQELVSAYISKGYGDPYCDACVREGIGIANSKLVNLITSTLATTDRFVALANVLFAVL